jgi:hypothetical protein
MVGLSQGDGTQVVYESKNLWKKAQSTETGSVLGGNAIATFVAERRKERSK